MAESRTIQRRGQPPRSFVAMADRTAFAEDPSAALIIITRHVRIHDRTFQANSQINKVFQAETTANACHEPKLTP